MIRTLAHVCIFSQDLNRSLDFYCGTLGLRRHFDFIKNSELFGFYLEIHHGHFIEIFKSDTAAGTQAQPINHLCFEVENIDTLRHSLIAKGVAVTPKKMGCDQSWQCWCKDPDGVSLEFQEYTPHSSQLTRAKCQVDW